MRQNASTCHAEAVVEVIGGRWKIVIIWNLFQRTMRFSELVRAIPEVTEKMLIQQLREMERDGVVARQVYPQVPPKVEYSLTPLGESLKPVLDAMCEWGYKRSRKTRKCDREVASSESLTTAR